MLKNLTQFAKGFGLVVFTITFASVRLLPNGCKSTLLGNENGCHKLFAIAGPRGKGSQVKRHLSCYGVV